MRRSDKANQVRAYLRKNSGMMPKDAADALTAQGIEVSAGYVSNLKSSLKSRKRAAKQRKAAEVDVLVSVDALKRAKAIVKEMGSVAEAKKALEAIAQIMD